MFKSQKVKTILFYFFFISLVTVSYSGKCDDTVASLYKADSLFGNKKFTEALAIYTELEQRGTSTSSMYLKMAYIKEALKDIPGTLFYLNKYYLSSKNKIALKKMENLAKQNGLEGFDYSDREFLENLVLKYGAAISFLLVIILLLLFALMFYRRVFQNKRSLVLQSAVLAFTVIVLMNGNIWPDKKYGIVNAPHSFLMSDPSSGSSVVEQIKPGTRFLVRGGNDIWLKMKGEEQSGYVRKSDLLLVSESQPLILWLVDRI